jgi:hypothetical protein
MRETMGPLVVLSRKRLATQGHRAHRASLAMILIAGSAAVGCAGYGVPAAASRGEGSPAEVSPARASSAPAPVPAMLVSCAPGQQAEVRQVARDGALVPLVACIDAPSPARVTSAVAPRAALPVEVPAEMASENDRVVYVPRTRARTQPAVYRSVEEMPAAPRVPVRRSGRSWQKSAVIIGSAAGIGAGIGGAIGGGKGALIGAAVGGGGATIWDQTTRR